MTRWVISGFKDREEKILQNLLEVTDHVLRFVNITVTQSILSIIVDCRNVGPSSINALLKTGNLNQPSNIIWVNIIWNCPISQLFPFIPTASVNRQSEFCVLILALVQIWHYFLWHKENARTISSAQNLFVLIHLNDTSEVFPSDHVVCLEKNLSQSGFSDRIVFGVEFVEPMERIAILQWILHWTYIKWSDLLNH